MAIVTAKMAMYEQEGQIEHPDRVAWYQSLLQEWTGQVPGVQVVEDQGVAAWVQPYTSPYGMFCPQVTQAWAGSVEDALATLCSWVFEDIQADGRALQAMTGMLVGR